MTVATFPEPSLSKLPALLPMTPRYVEKLWGGARIAALPAKQGAPPPYERTGESWEVADLPEGCSSVAGTSLRTLVAEHGRALVGTAAPIAADGALRFPLLVKLIDAEDDLSVQVHPDAAYARAHPGSFAKDEAWLIVDAAAGAAVLHGARRGVSRSDFERAILDGRADQMLRSVRVSAGDVLRIRPGTLHAVQRGCLILEVQEPSDTTFRVFDYGRTDKDGKPRALHVAEALAVARFDDDDLPLLAPVPAGAHRQTLVASPRYVMSSVDVAPGEPASLPTSPATPMVLFCLRGAIDVEADGERCTLLRGATAVVPACTREVLLQAPASSTAVWMALPC